MVSVGSRLSSIECDDSINGGARDGLVDLMNSRKLDDTRSLFNS